VPSELLASRLGGRTWLALREDGVVAELRVEDDSEAARAGRIVKGRVTKVVPGIQSAFLDVGQERDAFLHAADLIVPGEAPVAPPVEADASGTEDADDEPETTVMHRARRALPSRPPIQDRIREGRELLVQVAREAIGGKGPRVTCFVTLPGRFLVHAPHLSFRGVSRRISDPEERQRLRGILDALPGGDGGFVVRTVGDGATAEAFSADAALLRETWSTILRRFEERPAPSLLHADLGLFGRAVRDASAAEITRIVVDDVRLRDEARSYLAPLDPLLASRVELHLGRARLFDEAGLSQEIEKALKPRVWLRSGGTIVIQPTEALVSIDVNTGKFVGGREPLQTILRTNLEAAEEIARQLRLRDLGGIIVIDFIDMDRPDDQRRVIDALHAALARDRARTKIVGLSDLGLLQLTRKRTRPGFAASLTAACPCCAGIGRIKTPRTVAGDALAEALRLGEAMPEARIKIRARLEVAQAIRLALQTAGEAIDDALVARLSVEDDESAAPDSFEASAL